MNDSQDTLKTSPSIRRKGKIISRMVVNCLKFFRVFCPGKKHEKASIDIKNAN